MSESSAPSRVTASLHAENQLLVAGLERAARMAGVTVVDIGEPATISLRSRGVGITHEDLDVLVDDGRVLVTLAVQPSPEAWSAVLGLIAQLKALPTSSAIDEAPNGGVDRQSCRT